MARSSKISLTASQAGVHDLSLADQLFAVVTRKTPDAAADLLPENEKMRGAAISAFQKAHSDRLARLTPVTEIEKSSRLLSPVIAVWSRIGSVKYLSAAAAMVIATGAGLLLFNPFGEDSIHIEDESGQSAMLSEVNANDKSVSLNFMRRRKKSAKLLSARVRACASSKPATARLFAQKSHSPAPKRTSNCNIKAKPR